MFMCVIVCVYPQVTHKALMNNCGLIMEAIMRIYINRTREQVCVRVCVCVCVCAFVSMKV
jgi:hypothetical protein